MPESPDINNPKIKAALDLRLPDKRPVIRRTSSTESEDEESNLQGTGISLVHGSNLENHFMTTRGVTFLPHQTSSSIPSPSAEHPSITLQNNSLSEKSPTREASPRDIHQPLGKSPYSMKKTNLLVDDLLSKSILPGNCRCPKEIAEDSPTFLEDDLPCKEIQTDSPLFEMSRYEPAVSSAKSSTFRKVLPGGRVPMDSSSPRKISSACVAENPRSNAYQHDRKFSNGNLPCKNTVTDGIRNSSGPKDTNESPGSEKHPVYQPQTSTSTEESTLKETEDVAENDSRAKVADDTMSLESFDALAGTENPHETSTAADSAEHDASWSDHRKDTALVSSARCGRLVSDSPPEDTKDIKNEPDSDTTQEAKRSEINREIQVSSEERRRRYPFDLLARSVYHSVYRRFIPALMEHNLDCDQITRLLESGHLTDQLETLLDASVRKLVLTAAVTNEESRSPVKKRNSPEKTFLPLKETRSSPKTNRLQEMFGFQDNSFVQSTPCLEEGIKHQMAEKREYTDDFELRDKSEHFRGYEDAGADAHECIASNPDSQTNSNRNVWQSRSELNMRNKPVTENAISPRVHDTETTIQEERGFRTSVTSNRLLDIAMKDTERRGQALATEDNKTQMSRFHISDADDGEDNLLKRDQQPCLKTETRDGQRSSSTEPKKDSSNNSSRVVDENERCCLVGEAQQPMKETHKDRPESTKLEDKQVLASPPAATERNAYAGKRRPWTAEEGLDHLGSGDERRKSPAETIEAGPEVDGDEALQDVEDADLLRSYQVVDDKDNIQLTDGGVTLTLVRTSMWRAFNKIDTEMIINRSGRRMFPFVTLQLSGLDERGVYDVEMEIVPADRRRYKFVNKTWAAVGVADAPITNPPYSHVDSPNSGGYWMSRQIQFTRVKLTNNRDSSDGNILLHSMHKYVVQINVRQVQDIYAGLSVRTYRFRLNITSFIAVTAYQNEYVTRLKIHNNPFAKAFRDSSIIVNSKKGTVKRREHSCADDSGESGEDGPTKPKIRETESSRVTSAIRDSSRLFHPSATTFSLPPPRVDGHFGLHLRHTVPGHDTLPMTQPFIWMPGMTSPWMGLDPGVVSPYFFNPSHSDRSWKARGAMESSSLYSQKQLSLPSPLPPLPSHASFCTSASAEHSVVSAWPPGK